MAHCKGQSTFWSIECDHWKNVCKQLKLSNYRKLMAEYKITYVVDNV